MVSKNVLLSRNKSLVNNTIASVCLLLLSACGTGQEFPVIDPDESIETVAMSETVPTVVLTGEIVQTSSPSLGVPELGAAVSGGEVGNGVASAQAAGQPHIDASIDQTGGAAGNNVEVRSTQTEVASTTEEQDSTEQLSSSTGTSDSKAVEFLEVVAETVTMSTATITWTLNKFATGQIEYGEDTSYGNSTRKETSFDYSTHRQTMSDLQPNTEYHFRLRSVDADGNEAVSGDYTFVTSGLPLSAANTNTGVSSAQTEDASTSRGFFTENYSDLYQELLEHQERNSQESVESQEQDSPEPLANTADTSQSIPVKFLDVVIESTTATEATISWTLSKPATGQLEYGIDTGYGRFSRKESSFDYDQHRRNISGLTPNTEYHFRLLAVDNEGVEVASDDHIFVTTAVESRLRLHMECDTYICRDGDGWGEIPQGCEVV